MREVIPDRWGRITGREKKGIREVNATFLFISASLLKDSYETGNTINADDFTVYLIN